MGYSCTKQAMDTFEKVMDIISDNGSANTWKHEDKQYFAEIGRENEDGAITGTVYEIFEEVETISTEKNIPSACYKRGSYRIEPDGLITRWSCLPTGIKDKVNKEVTT